MYLMIFTTLIPTLVHMIAGLGALFAQKSRLWARVARELRAHMAATPDEALPVAQINTLVRRVRTGWFWGVFTAFLVVGVPLVLIAAYAGPRLITALPGA